MLSSFRSLSDNFLAKIFLGFLVLTFAVWGIEDMVRRPGQSTAVATVGEASISADVYRRALHDEMEKVRRALGDRYTPELAKTLGIERYVLRSLIERALLDQESEALGLAPADADVVRRIRSNPAFQDKGIFDKQLFETSLSRMGISEKNYVERVRREMASQLIVDTLTARAPVPDIAVETLYKAREQLHHATIYTLTARTTAPTPPAGALESFYAERAQAFNAPEYRAVTYVVLTPENASGKIEVPETSVLAAYKERIDEFKRPERRTVEQLLFADRAEADKAHALLQSGKPFDQVAKTAPILNKGALSLGKVEKGAVLEGAADAVFSLKAGEYTAPVQSAFGWHIFRVEKIEPPSTAPINEVRDMLEKDLRRQAMENALNKLANRLEDTLAGGGSLEEAAKELGLTLAAAGPFTRDGKSPDGTAAKLPDLEKFVDASFAAEERTESPLMHASGGRSYLVRVDKVMPERQRSLDEVRGLALAAWQHQEAAKELAERATEAARALADKSGRGEAIAKFGLKPAFNGALKRNGDKAGTLALPAALKAELFALAPGESTSAYPLPSGEYAIAVAGERTLAGAFDPAAAQPLKEELAETMKNELVAQYFAWLERKYPVEINQSLLQAAED